ncbi:ATP-binding protein [Azohydromonas caseinilytica]|uniref:ATP-binding protein n=1 Tax=Azohydromonas caseinilytica TaxID=2728836 RepID=UPI00145DD2E0|nr:ATP-binding protein [Azohydromonas caseinilytica]
MALPSGGQLVSPLLLGLLLTGLHLFDPAWFHGMADLLPLTMGAALLLITRQGFDRARHASMRCAATGFFWAAVIDVLHSALQERMLDLGGFPAEAPLLLSLGARTLQATALLLAPVCAGGGAFRRLGAPGFPAAALLLVVLVRVDAWPRLQPGGEAFSVFRIAWEWLLLILYAGAAWLLFQRRAALGAALCRSLLMVVALLMLGELMLAAHPPTRGFLEATAHILKSWSYWLLLWIVNQHLLVQPRQLLRRQTQLLEDVTSQVPGLAWQLLRTPAGQYRFTFASSGAAQIFELTAAELLQDAQLGFARIVPKDHEQLMAALERSCASLTPWKAQWQVVLPNQGRRWHRGESSVPVVEPDGSCRWVGHIQDITEEQLVGLELAQHRDHLAALVEERTEALRHSMLQTEQAARARTEFLSSMSHEIRTPLNAILGVSQIALRDAQAVPAQAYLRQIHDSGRLLLALVNDILDMAKIEAGRLELESRPVRLSAVIQRAMRLTAHRAQQQRLEFGVSCGADLPQGILADETRLTQVLVNLLGNAIKFTEQGSVHMTVSRLPHGRWLLFAIQDTGIGMSPVQLEQLFQPFTQGDASTTRRFGGTGLGLSIAKRIVDRMGGSIEVASQLGHGSCFTLRIPFDEAPPPEERAAPVPDASMPGLQRLRGLRILAAEDDAVNQWVLKDLLEQEGARCRIADNGLAALALLEAGEEFDLFLTDVQMPGLNGYDTARRCRALRPQLPIVGITAYALPQERQRCLDAGMDEHITKPVDVDPLCTALLALLGRRAQRLPPSPPAPAPAVRAAPAADPQAAPVLDWGALWQRLRRPASVRMILETLLAEHGPTPQRLRRCLADMDPAEAGRLAHRLRGLCATVFAAPAREAAERLDQQLRTTGRLEAGPVEALAQATEALLDGARAGLADLEATRPRPQASAPAETRTPTGEVS